MRSAAGRHRHRVAVAALCVLLAGCERWPFSGCGPAGGGRVRAGDGAPGEGSQAGSATGTVGTPTDPLLVFGSAAPGEGPAPLAVALAVKVEGGAPPFAFRWRFGDGSPESSERSPRHTYAAPGTYRAELRVTGPGGESDQDEVFVVVR